MRQLSPLTNLLLAVLAALGMVAALGLPWFAHAGPARADDTGRSVEGFADRLARTFSSDGAAVSGTDALGSSQTVVLVAAGLVALLSSAMLVPLLRDRLRDLARAAGLAVPLLVVFVSAGADTPALELRWGLVVCVALALFVASAVWHGAAVRSRRRPAASARLAA